MLGFGFHGVRTRLQLRETEATSVVGFYGALHAVFGACDGDGGGGDRGTGLIGDRADDGAGCLTLAECGGMPAEHKEGEQKSGRFK